MTTAAPNAAATRSPAWLGGAAAVAAAGLLWLAPSKAVTDVLLWGAFLWALPRARRAARLWLSPPGFAALLVALYPVVQLAWAVDPAAAANDLLRDARLAAGAFALSVWLGTEPRRAERPLMAGLLALLPILVLDLVRITRAIGFATLLENARYYKPYALNHPNVSSLLAAAAVFVALQAAWSRRGRPAAATGFGLGAGLALAYLVVMASRAPQTAFAATAGAALLLIPRNWKGRGAGLALALLAAFAIGANLSRVNARFLNTSDPLSGRLVVWRQTLALAQERPWFGHGYGKTVFQQVYAASNPPPSPHYYPHPHQHALFVLFQGGRAWLILHAALVLLLAVRLAGALRRTSDPDERLRIALVALLLILWGAFGLGDYPDNRLKLALAALLPLALAVSAPNAVTRTSACGCAESPAAQKAGPPPPAR